jgi:hypothetical protein
LPGEDRARPAEAVESENGCRGHAVLLRDIRHGVTALDGVGGGAGSDRGTGRGRVLARSFSRCSAETEGGERTGARDVAPGGFDDGVLSWGVRRDIRAAGRGCDRAARRAWLRKLVGEVAVVGRRVRNAVRGKGRRKCETEHDATRAGENGARVGQSSRGGQGASAHDVPIFRDPRLSDIAYPR